MRRASAAELADALAHAVKGAPHGRESVTAASIFCRTLLALQRSADDALPHRRERHRRPRADARPVGRPGERAASHGEVCGDTSQC